MQPCGRGRLLLVVYLDFLLFVSVAEPLAWLAHRALSFDAGLTGTLIGFAVWETAALTRGRGSLGSWALGIVRIDGVRYVLTCIRKRERWWTLLVGALGVLSGAKEVTRWTQGLPPPPFMGLALGWNEAAAIVALNGALAMAAAIGVLRTSARAALLGALLSALGATSWLFSWAQVPAWVAARTVARRALQGISVPEGEIARMQWILPGGALAGSILGGLWLLCSWRRFRACDRAAHGPADDAARAV